MKKVSLSLLVILMITGTAVAQQTASQKPVYQKVEASAPQAVLDAVERHNKGFEFKSKKRAVLAKKLETKESYVADVKSRSLDKKSHAFKRTLYKADGSVISYREELLNHALPKPVLRTIGKEYNGWLLVRTRTVTEERGDARKVFYTAVLKNGSKKERIMLNETGQIVKSKRELKEDARRTPRIVVMK
ncbi:hypothetical protein [Cesiribacter sp. SM1]|uniref:hypothetical protein n=1 Tax=Cesiribacter sp. SM1 TaxID=2861196 RepID=UPI001CD5E4CD|nr:hypothetical protein [Cesiribacter sp. SM1]